MMLRMFVLFLFFLVSLLVVEPTPVKAPPKEGGFKFDNLKGPMPVWTGPEDK